MSKRSVFCIALSRGRAGRIVLDLKEAAFSCTEISALFLDQSAGVVQTASIEASASPDESPIQPAKVIYGMMAWIAAVGFCIIPGDDPIIAAGPIAATLTDEMAFGVVGGLSDFGLSQEEASSYEYRVRNGHILVSVHTESLVAGDRAREIFAAAGAEDICTTTEPEKRPRANPPERQPENTRESLAHQGSHLMPQAQHLALTQGTRTISLNF
jgi:hypothetical protein